MSFFSELKRRNVLRVGAAYVVVAWLVIQVVETILPAFGFGDAAVRIVTVVFAIGLIPTLIFAWAFELTPEGLKKEKDVDRSQSIAPQTSKKLDRMIMVVLALALGYFAFDKFVLNPQREAEKLADLAKQKTAEVERARKEGRTEALVGSFGDKSIAVLAFEDMSQNKDQEYLSDGIAEELLNLLAKVPGLRVISRSSAFSYKGKDIKLAQVAEELNVAHILEGSVRKAGNRVRITAQLIEARSDTHLWSETYDRTLRDIFEIQDEIAASILEELKPELLGEALKSRVTDEEAYELVLQARYFWNRRAEGDAQRALDLYRKATDIDTGYASAWTGLSVAYAVAAYDGRIDMDEGMVLARAAVDKAIEIDPGSAEAHVRLGQALSRENDLPGMQVEFQKAYEIEPNNPLVLGVLAMQAGRQGQIDRAVELFDQAAVVDPLGAIWPMNKGSWLIRMGRLDEAEMAIERAFELNGNLNLFRANMVDIHILRGEYAKALEMLDAMPAEELNKARAAIVYFGLGEKGKSEDLLEEILAEANSYAYLGMAIIHAARSEADQAFEWLTKVKGVSPWNIVYDPYIRLLVEDPRWEPYVDSLDWPWAYEY